MKDIEVKLDTSGKPLDFDKSFSIDDFTREIIDPKLGKLRKCMHFMEREAMECAIRHHSRRVYVCEWWETHEERTEIRFGIQHAYCWLVYPYNERSSAFKVAQRRNGLVRVMDFKVILELDEDKFNSIDSPNRDLAEKIRSMFR